MKDGDYIEHLFVCSTHDYLLFFTNRGKVYRSKVYELPEASRTAKGRALVNVLPLREGERVQSVLATRDFAEAEYLVFATQQGHDQEDRVPAPTTRRSRPTASSPSTSATTTSSSPCGASTGTTRSSWSRAPAWPCASTSREARAMGRDTGGVRGMNVGQRATRSSPWTSPATTRSCSSSPRTATASARRSTSTRKTARGAKGVKTITLTERQGRPGRRAGRARAPGARLHLPGGHGAAHRRARHQPAGPLGAGRHGDEPARRRSRVSASRSWSSPRRHRDARRWPRPIRPLPTGRSSAAEAELRRETEGAGRRRLRGRPATCRRPSPSRAGTLDHQRKEVVRIVECQFLRDPGGGRPLGRQGWTRSSESTPGHPRQRCRTGPTGHIRTSRAGRNVQSVVAKGVSSEAPFARRRASSATIAVRGLAWLGTRTERSTGTTASSATGRSSSGSSSIRRPASVPCSGRFATGPVGFLADDVEAARAELEAVGVELLGPIGRATRRARVAALRLPTAASTSRPRAR